MYTNHFMYSKPIVLGIQEWRAGQICHSRMCHIKQLSADGNLRFGDVSRTVLAPHWASWGKVNAHSMVSVHFQEFPSHGHSWIRVPVSPTLTLLQSHFFVPFLLLCAYPALEFSTFACFYPRSVTQNIKKCHSLQKHWGGEKMINNINIKLIIRNTYS